MPIPALIAGLFVYPVKGCGAIALHEATLTPRGLEHDRRWMVVSREGRYLSQREVPRLACLRPAIAGEMLSLHADGEVLLSVPVTDAGDPVRVMIWRDEVMAVATTARADTALSAWLGRPARLVRFPEAVRRPCDPAYAPPGSHTAFADGFPVLVTSESSLRVLNEALQEAGHPPVPMSRFRPNLVLASVPAGAEDEHGLLRLEDGLALALVKRCDRCVVTTVDQESGRRSGNEPVATLMRVRRNRRTGGAWFGQNAIPIMRPEMATPPLWAGEACSLLDA